MFRKSMKNKSVGGVKGQFAKVIAIVAAVAITFTSVNLTSFATNSDNDSALEASYEASDDNSTEDTESEEAIEEDDDIIVISEDEVTDEEPEDEASFEGEAEADFLEVADEDASLDASDGASNGASSGASNDAGGDASSGASSQEDPVPTTYETNNLRIGVVRISTILEEAKFKFGEKDRVWDVTPASYGDYYVAGKCKLNVNNDAALDDNGNFIAPTGDEPYDWFINVKKIFTDTKEIKVKVGPSSAEAKEYTLKFAAHKVEITVTKDTFVYNGKKQGITKDDITVKLDGSETALSKDMYTVDGELEGTDADVYTFKVNLLGDYAGISEEYNWEIKAIEVNVSLSFSYLVEYTSTKPASSIAKAVLNQAKKDKKITATVDGLTYDVANITGLYLELSQDDVVIDEDEILDAGKYSVSAESTSVNYKITCTKTGTLTIKAASMGTVSLNSKFAYGDKISATISCDNVTAATWVVKRGDTNKNGGSIVADSNSKISKTVDVNNSSSPLSVGKYTLEVTFVPEDDSESNYNTTVTKDFTVEEKSISTGTLSSDYYSPTGSLSTNTTSSSSITIAYTSSQASSEIAPNIKKLKVGNQVLEVDEDFEVTGQTDKKKATTSKQSYTITLKGIGDYTGERKIVWTIASTTSSSTTAKGEVSFTTNSGVSTTVTSVESKKIDTYAKNTAKKSLKLYIKPFNSSNLDAQSSTIVDKITEEYVNAYANASSSDVVVDCLDISIKDSDDNEVTELNSYIDIILTVGTTNASKNVRIVREHDGTATELQKITSSSNATDGTYIVDKKNGKIYIYSKLFSNYTLVYTPDSTSSTTSTKTSTSSSEDSSVNGARAPKTGDTLPVVWVWALVLLAGVVITSYAIYGSLAAKKVKATDSKKKRDRN